MTAAIGVLVVDDDLRARQRLRDLSERAGGLAVIGECADGREAVDALSAGQVDLVFLDVEMPRLDGFGVIAEIGLDRMPPVIFTSAYSEFGVRAFESYALDYLLKPFDESRFLAAVDRVRAPVGARDRQGAARRTADPRLRGLLEHVQDHRRGTHPEAIAIRTGGQYAVVRVADVDWIEADGNYSRVYVQKRPRILTRTLATLEREVLDPAVFVRVHRSAIVNGTKIVAVEAHGHGDLTLVLHDGTHVHCSRRYRARLEDVLYFTT
ncbi:MAG: response regulator transcription factor [Gemmatimonadaceae bacterium]|nr:response regulator transcription factor [Gemmatimonadaceae bacterium]